METKFSSRCNQSQLIFYIIIYFWNHILHVNKDGNETRNGWGQAQSEWGLLFSWYELLFIAWAFSVNKKPQRRSGLLILKQSAFKIKKRITWNYAEGTQNILVLYFLSLCIHISPHDTFKSQQLEKSGLQIWSRQKQ